jgi:D-sedoheptulose 7-phosphate isomerase
MSQLVHSDMLVLNRRQALLSESLGRLEECLLPLASAAELLTDTLRDGGRVLIAGNGGSAAQAEHFAAELVGRFLCDRAPFAAMALTADTSTLTAIANDFGYCEVFARQLEGLGRPGDAFVGISTSGNSANVVRAAEEAHRLGISVIGLTGERPNQLSERATVAIHAPASETSTIQEMHLVIVHHLAEMVEQLLTGRDGTRAKIQ